MDTQNSNMGNSNRRSTMYAPILRDIFFKYYKPGLTEFTWYRQDIEESAARHNIPQPKNGGDLLYSFRFRTPMPDEIVATAPEGLHWVIELAGKAIYCFRLRKQDRIVPSAVAFKIKIPDATPQIINMYAKTDEQALLAKVRYNRLIDIFLRITAYPLQSHLRTSVKDIGQIEIDELYVGVRNTGQEFIIPVQAKGGNDTLGATQARQDFAFCQKNYPMLTPRLIACQFMASDLVAMFELTFQDDQLAVVDERHYQLVTSGITDDDLLKMANLD